MTRDLELLPRLLLAGLLALPLSCKATLQSSVADGAVLGKDESYFVVTRTNDTHGIDTLMREWLRESGRTAESGDISALPTGTDIVVFYEDQWQWDFSDFLLSLTIRLHQVATDQLLATGQSVRYSFARKAASEMVHEVLADIFTKAEEATADGSPP